MDQRGHGWIDQGAALEQRSVALTSTSQSSSDRTLPHDSVGGTGHGGKSPMREWRSVGRPFLVEIFLLPSMSEGDEPTRRTTNHA